MLAISCCLYLVIAMKICYLNARYLVIPIGMTVTFFTNNCKLAILTGFKKSLSICTYSCEYKTP